MTYVSAMDPLAGADVADADLLPIVDMSETGAFRNKHINLAEFKLALAEPIQDTVNTMLVAGTNVTLTYDDGLGTLTIDAATPAPGDISGLNEAIDDRVAALLQAGSNVTLTYNDGAGTLTIASAGGGGGGDMLAANNLSDLADAPTARGNLGLGSIATQAASSVSITGGSVAGITDLAVADGGTGASSASAARSNLGAAAATQTDEQISGFIASPSNKDYRIALDMKHGGTITEVTTRSASGTCTATWKINTTALGGTANSVSSTETTQSHSSANVFAAGDDIVLTVSSNSSCADMSFTIKYTRTLA